jgi:cardiolipin synthase
LQRGQRGEQLDAPASELSTRVWTIPNVLSMLRLAGVPAVPLLGAGHRAGRPRDPAADGGRAPATTSTADRPQYGQFTRLGPLLDPLADRLYILATLLALVYRDGCRCGGR